MLTARGDHTPAPRTKAEPQACWKNGVVINGDVDRVELPPEVDGGEAAPGVPPLTTPEGPLSVVLAEERLSSQGCSFSCNARSPRGDHGDARRWKSAAQLCDPPPARRRTYST